MENCKTCNHSGEVHDETGCNHHRHGALCECNCKKFVSPALEAIKSLSDEDKIKLVCLNHFGLDPRFIARAEFATDDGGHFTGIRVVLHFPTGRQVGEWIEDHLPKDKYPEAKFLRQEIIDFVSRIADVR